MLICHNGEILKVFFLCSLLEVHEKRFVQGVPRRLKTQDRVRQWDVGPNVDLSTLRCKLCDAQPDLHEHLYLECPYSARIWILIRSLAGMELISPRSPEELREANCNCSFEVAHISVQEYDCGSSYSCSMEDAF
ncbi:hypothetical protein Tco_0388651 [Tanacetum coccineum]